MTIELTEEQRQALAREGPSSLRVIDPMTQAAYVLVPAEIYDRMRKLVPEDDIRLLEPYLAELSPEDWEDLANYDNP